MSSLFARVVKQALITFERENNPTFLPNFMTLKQLVDQLTPKDLNIDPTLLSTNYFKSDSEKAPVTYIEIYEHKTFTMSVFIMQNKYTMPMHDHAGYGLLRVLSGTAKIQSYSLETDSAITSEQQRYTHILPVIVEPSRDVSVSTECSVLTPTKCNIHEITANGGSTAFFDILSPPYESNFSSMGPKKCIFYRKVQIRQQNNNANPNRVYLQRINVPDHYYCDNVDYHRPDFLSDPNFFNFKNSQEAY